MGNENKYLAEWKLFFWGFLFLAIWRGSYRDVGVIEAAIEVGGGYVGRLKGEAIDDLHRTVALVFFVFLFADNCFSRSTSFVFIATMLAMLLRNESVLDKRYKKGTLNRKMYTKKSNKNQKSG